jgi:hypothetical protein
MAPAVNLGGRTSGVKLTWQTALIDGVGSAPQDLSNSEFALAVGFGRVGGGSDGSSRGAFGIAQRRIPARVAGEAEL